MSKKEQANLTTSSVASVRDDEQHHELPLPQHTGQRGFLSMFTYCCKSAQARQRVNSDTSSLDANPLDSADASHSGLGGSPDTRSPPQFCVAVDSLVVVHSPNTSPTLAPAATDQVPAEVSISRREIAPCSAEREYQATGASDFHCNFSPETWS